MTKSKNKEPIERTIPVVVNPDDRRRFLYKERNSYQMSDEKIFALMDDMLEYALDEKNEVLTMLSLCRAFFVGHTLFCDWLVKYPEYREKFNEIKLHMIDRKYLGAIHRKYDAYVARGPFGHFSHPEIKGEWKEDLKYVSETKAAEQGHVGNATFTIVAAPIPDTAVPAHPSLTKPKKEPRGRKQKRLEADDTSGD